MIQLALPFLMTSIAMSFIIIVVLVIGNIFPNIFTAKLRYIAWVIILLGLIIPMRPLIGSGLVDIPIATQGQATNDNLLQQQAHAQAQDMGGNQPIADTEIPEAATNNAQPQTAPPQPYQTNRSIDIIALFWLVPAILVFSYHLWKYAKFIRLVKRWSRPVIDEEIISLFESIKAKKKIRRYIALKKCSFVSTSMLIGFLRPVIILPARNFDKEELSLIFLHELTHYKRGDLYIKLASVAVSALHWFNPAVYFMSAAMQTDCEASCDEIVLQEIGGDNRQFYAELIMEMIGGQKSQGTLLSTCFFASTRGVKVRMGAIMDAKKTMRGLVALTLAILIFPIVLSGSVFAITPMQQDITPAISIHQGIGLSQAREIALSVVEGGTLQRIEAGYVEGDLILGIAVSQGERFYRIVLDAANGAILNLHIQSPHETHGITLSQAIQIAHNDLIQNEVSAAFSTHFGIDWEYGHWVWELEFESDLGRIEYYIDINNGNIIKFAIYYN